MAANIPYYVTENFHEYQGSLGRLEVAVEDEYKTNLRYACNRERNYSECIIGTLISMKFLIALISLSVSKRKIRQFKRADHYYINEQN